MRENSAGTKNPTHSMKIKLVEGQFTDIESIDIITRLIQVEIKFHEGKIEMRSSKNER
jgi:gluconate kinase